MPQRLSRGMCRVWPLDMSENHTILVVYHSWPQTVTLSPEGTKNIKKYIPNYIPKISGDVTQLKKFTFDTDAGSFYSCSATFQDRVLLENNGEYFSISSIFFRFSQLYVKVKWWYSAELMSWENKSASWTDVAWLVWAHCPWHSTMALVTHFRPELKIQFNHSFIEIWTFS